MQSLLLVRNLSASNFAQSPRLGGSFQLHAIVRTVDFKGERLGNSRFEIGFQKFCLACVNYFDAGKLAYVLPFYLRF